jgi:hypothetical protein
MTRWAAAFFLMWACGDDEGVVETGDAGLDASLDGGRDAASDAGLDAGAAPGLVASSLATWSALAAANPGPYWYEDENCRVNSPQGGTNFVQVEQGPARLVGATSFPRSECRASVNRYGTLVGDATMPGLHAACEALLKRRSDTRLRFDAQGVVSECWVGDAPNCRDNCGEGFYLRRWGFGRAPVSDAGTPDAGS